MDRARHLDQLALAPQAQVGGHLVVAAAGGVQLGARRAGELGDAALDRGVDVLVRLDEHERTVADLALDLIERGEHRVALVVRDQPDPGEAAHVGARAGDVVAPEAAVERQARRVRHQRCVGAAFEAAVPQRRARHHAGPFDSMPARSRSVSAKRSPPAGSVATHSIVSSPATVPSKPFEPAAVERRGDDVGAPRRRAHDDEVAGARHLGDPLPHHAAQVVERGDTLGRELGHGVHRRPARHADLDRAEILEVARHGRLGCGDPLAGEQLHELRLVRHLVLLDQTGDRLLSLHLAHRASPPRSPSPLRFDASPA